MPSRNVIRQDVDESFYHLYARGASKKDVFKDEQDYVVFLNLLKRYLSNEETKDKFGRNYANFYGQIELIAFCLMPNHYHLMVYQSEAGMVAKLMSGVMTSYSRYFNQKYKQSGSLFESRYKSSLIDSDVYLQHITRYIHLNPKQWRVWKWSSLPYFTGEYQASWVIPTRALELFSDQKRYIDFVCDYEEYGDSLKLISKELANTLDGE